MKLGSTESICMRIHVCVSKCRQSKRNCLINPLFKTISDYGKQLPLIVALFGSEGVSFETDKIILLLTFRWCLLVE